MADRQFIIDNLAFRTSCQYLDYSVNFGAGNPYAKLVIVHHSHNIPDRDGTSGALRRFGLLDQVYRIPYEVVQGLSQKENRLILKEFLQIIKPLMVVTSGRDATEILKNKNLRSFKAQSGKGFLVEDLTDSAFYAILSPEEYSFARAPTHLKDQGRQEWEHLVATFNKLLHQHETDRWRV